MVPDTRTYVDQTLTCIDCEQPFQFTMREQAFYARMSFVPPRRCPDCRAYRREERQRDMVQS